MTTFMIRNTASTTTPPVDQDLVDQITIQLTPTNTQVVDWHTIDKTLQDDWERPLVAILRFFVDP